MDYAYNILLVLFSAIIAVVSSYFVIELNAETLFIFNERLERIIFWVFNSSLMAVGIWGMHFVAMVAFSWEFQITYDLATVVVSYLVAMGGCFLHLLIISRPYVNSFNVAAGAIAMGSAISGMHYVGMNAMRIENVEISYILSSVIFSVVIAIFLSLIAILLTLELREPACGKVYFRKKVLFSLLMAIAMLTMHYTGMAATRFTVGTNNTLIGDNFLTPGVLGSCVTLVVFGCFFVARTILSNAKLANYK